MAENAIEREIATQRKLCVKDFLQIKDFYRMIILTIAWIVAVFAGAAWYSVKPITDISTLKVKAELRDVTIEKMNTKLDRLLEGK